MTLKDANVAPGAPTRSAEQIRGELNFNLEAYNRSGATPEMMSLLYYGSNMELAAQIAELRAALEKYLETVKQ